jgi:predicted PurR-regulated permease PerM
MENNKMLTFSAGILAVFVTGVILRLAKPILFPFFLALLLYFLLSPALEFMVRLKIPRSIAIIFILLTSFLVVYLLGALFYSSGKAFVSNFPSYGQKINSIFEYLKSHVKFTRIKWDPAAGIGNLDINKIGSFLLSSLGTFFSFISNLFLIFIFLVFMLAGRGKLKVKIANSFSLSRASQIGSIIQNIDRQIQKYLTIKTIISLITGVVTTVVLMIFGVDFAIVFGFLTFLLNYIPTIGSVIATALPVLIALFQFGRIWPAFWIFVIITVADNILGNFLEPKLMGKGLGLSPLAVLFSLFFWGWLWGIPGMILSVPILAVIKIVCGNVPSLKFLEMLLSK